MIYSFQGSNNKKAASKIEKTLGVKIINDEVLKGRINNHRFSIGQKCELFI